MLRPVHACLLLSGLMLVGCAMRTGSSAGDNAPRPERFAGQYRLMGRVQGLNINAAIRVDTAGRVYYLAGTPAAANQCEEAVLRDAQMNIRCGTVGIALAIKAERIAPEGRLAFDLPGRTRVEHNPFACLQAPPDNQSCVQPPSDTRTRPVSRVVGKVQVQKLAE